MKLTDDLKNHVEPKWTSIAQERELLKREETAYF